MASHNVTVTQTTTTKVSSSFQFDPSFVKSKGGILKLVQIILSLIGFICVQSTPYESYRSAGAWYSFVAMTAFWVTLLLLIFYLFHIIEKLHKLPWLLAETVYCAIWAIFFFISGAVSATHAKGEPAWGAAGFFAFGAMLVYGYDAFVKFSAWRNGEIAQGERITAQSSSDMPPSSPSYPAY